MLATMRPYTPSLYLPDGFAKYRQYPHDVDTPIPGAGYDVGEMEWAEQPINLRGSMQRHEYGRYGHYAKVPLRGDDDGGMFEGNIFGMGQASFEFELDPSAQFRVSVRPQEPPPGMPPPAAPPPDVPEETNWLPWVLGLGALAVVGGGAVYLARRKTPRKNRRRPRRRR